jgi:hypothetical protein
MLSIFEKAKQCDSLRFFRSPVFVPSLKWRSSSSRRNSKTMNDSQHLDFILDNNNNNNNDSNPNVCNATPMDGLDVIDFPSALLTASPSLTFLSTSDALPLLSTQSESTMPSMHLHHQHLPSAVEQPNTLSHARIQFNGNHQYWILTHAFFCDDPNRERKQRRKKFFERWLKRNFDASRHQIRGIQLAVLRTHHYVPGSCNTATLVPLVMFDEIVSTFNESRARDSITVTRQQIAWQDVSL